MTMKIFENMLRTFSPEFLVKVVTIVNNTKKKERLHVIEVYQQGFC